MKKVLWVLLGGALISLPTACKSDAGLTELVINNATTDDVILGVYNMQALVAGSPQPSLGGEFLQPASLDAIHFQTVEYSCFQDLAVSLHSGSGKYRFLYLNGADLCGDDNHPAELVIYDNRIEVRRSQFPRIPAVAK